MTNPPDLSETAAYRLALRRLSVRDYSALELERYLRKKGFETKVVEATVERLMGEGGLSNERFERVFVASQIARGKGPFSIQMKLREKGLDREISDVRSMYHELAQEDEVVMARKIVDKRYRTFGADMRVMGRAFRLLLRRGFSPDAARRALGMGSNQDGAAQ